MNELENIYIRKSNDLIRKARFNLSLQQQKIILYLIGKINPLDEDFHEYTLNIQEFCNACGIDAQSGKTHEYIKEQIKTIADKSLWIKMPNGKETLIRWIEKATIDKGNIIIRLDNDLKPYLLNLHSNYTKYELLWTLAFKSKYTIRLYEYIKSIHYDKMREYTHTISIDELKVRLNAENYEEYYKFRQKILDKAIEEINAQSDIKLSYTANKEGRQIVSITITVKPITDFKERLEHYQKAQEGK